MKRLAIGLIAASALLSACNGVKNEPLPADPKDPALVKAAAELGEEDKKLLAGYLMRREMAKAFGGQQLADGAATIGEAMEAQRKWLANMTESQKKAEALKVEVESKRKLIADQISQGVTVAFLSADFIPSSFDAGRYDDYENLSFAVQNNGKKAIKALKGEAVFIDTFGDVYVKVPMQFEETLQPGEKKEIELGMEINKFMEDHKKIMSLDSSKKFRFEPDQIVYTDGSTLKAPDSVS